MWTDITTGKITHIPHFSYPVTKAMEDDSESYSLELTLNLHPTYVLFCSCIHFSFFLHTSVGGEKDEGGKLRIFSNSFKFISWTTAEASLMAVWLPICPLRSGTEEKPNSALLWLPYPWVQGTGESAAPARQ